MAYLTHMALPTGVDDPAIVLQSLRLGWATRHRATPELTYDAPVTCSEGECVYSHSVLAGGEVGLGTLHLGADAGLYDLAGAQQRTALVRVEFDVPVHRTLAVRAAWRYQWIGHDREIRGLGLGARFRVRPPHAGHAQ